MLNLKRNKMKQTSKKVNTIIELIDLRKKRLKDFESMLNCNQSYLFDESYKLSLKKKILINKSSIRRLYILLDYNIAQLVSKFTQQCGTFTDEIYNTIKTEITK